MFDIQTLLTSIRVRFWITFTFIFIVISSAYFLISHQLVAQQSMIKAINIAGKQRMLSQKIALHSTRIIATELATSEYELEEEALRQAVFHMRENQRVLSELSFDSLQKSELSLLYKNQGMLAAQVKRFTEQAMNVVAQSEGVSAQSTSFLSRDQVESFLNALDQGVVHLEQAAIYEKQRFEYLVLLLSLVVVFALVAAAYISFRPLRNRILKTYDQLTTEKLRVSDYQFAINKHSLVIEFSVSHDIVLVNKKVTELFGYSKEEMVGGSITQLLAKEQDQAFIDNIFKALNSGEIWRGTLCHVAKVGRKIWCDSTIIPLKNKDKEIESFMVLQTDITEQMNTEYSLRELHNVTANSSLSLDDKIQAILSQGKTLYQLPLALVSQITGNDYRVVYADTPGGEVNPGDSFDLANTYCIHTLKANRPTAFHHAGKSDIKSHPCYQGFGLESYIGAAIFVGTKRYGTLNFSSPEPYPHPFKHSDLELIQLMAQWIGFELERHEQQAHLFEQQQLMEQMSQLARIGAWEVDLQTNKIVWSPMTKIIHEVDAEYQPDLDTAINFYKEGDSRDRINKLVAESIEFGTSYHEELQLVTAKGNEIWVAAKGEAEFADGKCIRLYGSFQDISKQKKVDLALQEQNRRMALAADSAGIGIWELDLTDQSLNWDTWMFRLYGVSPDKFSGAYEAWEQGLHPEDAVRSAKELQDAIEGGAKFDTQFRIVWPDGSIRYIKAAAIVDHDEHNKPVSMIGVNYDVTDRVENELALTHAKLAAEAGARAKNEFLASMSHEIRTPMNGVVGMLELLKDTPLTQEQQHRLTIAQSSAESLLHLINDILDFSKIDADKLILEEITFDLTRMIGDLVESFATQVEVKGIELVADVSQIAHSHVIGDPSRIRQILTNLLNNSIKFTHQGEVVVTAELNQKSECECILTLTVSDTGIGIEEDKQASLFESFSQVDASTTREYGGTGLGLSIVKKLCNQMNGDVEVTSDFGKGSCFTCNIEVGVATTESNDTINFSGVNVLILDRNVTNGSVIEKQLSLWGANTFFAQDLSGVEALIRQEEVRSIFNLALISSQFIKDGSIEQIKTLGIGRKELPVVFMTSMQNKELSQLPESIRCIGHFPKPVTLADLHFLKEYIDENQAISKAVEEQNNQSLVTKSIATEPVDTSVNEEMNSFQWPEACKVLLVEDNRVNQMVAKGVLNKIGLACDVAVNGKDALEVLKQYPDDYSLILMDIQMPEMDGYQATQCIRKGDAGDTVKDIKIVAMTANAMRGDREKCLQAGMNDYLAKPINREEIIEKLVFWLGAKTES